MMQKKRSAIFLDKDGTLLDDVPFNGDPRAMRFSPGAADALRRLSALDLPMIVVSNQAGIAMGKIAESAMFDVERELRRMFAECGAELAGFYYCPHHPEAVVDEYRKACTCRKPMPGLLLKAAANHGIDTTASWMVGDILDDVEAGLSCGCRTVLLNNGNETLWEISARRLPNYTVENLDEAAEIIFRAQAVRVATPDEEASRLVDKRPPEASRLPQHPQHHRT